MYIEKKNTDDLVMLQSYLDAWKGLRKVQKVIAEGFWQRLFFFLPDFQLGILQRKIQEIFHGFIDYLIEINWTIRISSLLQWINVLVINVF